MYEEVKLSVPELRRHGWRPYEVIWEQVGEDLLFPLRQVPDEDCNVPGRVSSMTKG